MPESIRAEQIKTLKMQLDILDKTAQRLAELVTNLQTEIYEINRHLSMSAHPAGKGNVTKVYSPPKPVDLYKNVTNKENE